jgi:hypothetical protein
MIMTVSLDRVREAMEVERERSLAIVEACRACPHRAPGFIRSGLSPRQVREKLATERGEPSANPSGYSRPAPAADWATIVEAARQAGRLH